MLTTWLRALIVMTIAASAVSAQMDKARGGQLETFDGYYKQYYEQADRQQRDAANDTAARMMPALNEMIRSVCDLRDKLNDSGLGVLAAQTTKWCEQTVSFRDRNNRLMTKLKQVGEGYSSELSDLRSEHDTMVRMLMELYSAFLKIGQTMKSACPACVG